MRDVFQFQFLTILSVELHMESRGDLRPDPDFDPIVCLFYTIHNDVPEGEMQDVSGMIIVNSDSTTHQTAGNFTATHFPSPQVSRDWYTQEDVFI